MEELVFVYDFLAFEQLLVFVFEIDLLFVFTRYLVFVRGKKTNTCQRTSYVNS